MASGPASSSLSPRLFACLTICHIIIIVHERPNPRDKIRKSATAPLRRSVGDKIHHRMGL